MTQINIRFVTFLVFLTLALSACSPPPEEQLLADTTRLSILPAYRDFLAASRQLREATTTFCSATEQSTDTYTVVRSAWRNTATTWAGIQSLQFGPLLVDNQAWKVQFWPDRKNLIARKVEALIKEDAPIDVARVEKASVVVQGLSALEYLLFDDIAGQLSRYQQADSQRRCDLLIAASAHLEGVAIFLHTAWQSDGGNYAATFSQPGNNNQEYPEAKVAIGTLLDSLVYGLELIKRDKLERPLGLAETGTQIYLLEWWRARYSRAAIVANLSALHQLFSAGEGFGLDDYLQQVVDGTDLAKAIDQGFRHVISQASEIETPLFDAPSSPETLAQAKALSDTITELEVRIKKEIPPLLGITLSFNSSDGD